MNKMLAYLLVSVLMLGALASGVAEAGGEGLVAHYRLDEGGGAVAYDSSGNGDDGTLLGQPQWVEGPNGSGVALAFNPTDGCTGIECPTFDPTDGTGQFSFAIWALWDGDETYHHFFTKSDGWGADTMMFQLELWGGHTSATYTNKIGISYAPNSTAFNEMPKNEWTHVAFVYDGAEVVVYLNGIDELGPKPVSIGSASAARTVIGVADNDARVWTGALDDVQIYSRALGAGEIARIMEGSVELSSAPQPADGATDVPRDTALSWAAGEFAATHDVYLGTTFDDVNDMSRDDSGELLVSQDQSGTTYQPAAALAYGQTYYWRVDEVNSAPDYTIYPGAVWSFEVEPEGYPIETISVSASSFDSGSEPENVINGSGLDETDVHSSDVADMWVSSADGQQPSYIEFDFGQAYTLHQLLVWNYNMEFEYILGYGFKDVTITYSENGVDWTTWGDFEFAQGTSAAGYGANTTIDLTGLIARIVRLTANSSWGGRGAQYGLSEVRFLSIPTQARDPEPADGDSDVSLDTALTWRAGRGAAEHDVYLGTQADALVLAGAVTETTFTPTDLQLGATYYWKVDEVNEAETVSVWEGFLWRFVTQEYVTIDDFESYDDEENRVYDTWLDGWVNGSGSTVGYLSEPFAETSIVNGGRQSMPLDYFNSEAPYYSEAEYDAGGADWTAGGADVLRVHVRGQAANDAETLYLTLEDTSGNMAVVSNPDQTVVTTETWQEWVIGFDEFSGVDPTSVRYLRIGVGDRNAPASGGAGLIYVDDVGYGCPLGQ